MPYTSDDLVTEVRRRSRLPMATDVSDAEILQYADQEMQASVADVIRNIDASFWLTTKEHTLVSGTATYILPRRAIGGGIERVELEDSSGNREPVVALSEDESWRFANAGRSTHWPGRFAFTMEGEYLRLWPEPDSGDAGLTLRVRYQRQPSQLTAVSDCALIIGVNSTTEIVVSGAPSWLTVADADTYFDIVRGDGVHDLIAEERIRPAGGYAGGTVTISASTPIVVADISDSDAITGARRDYVCQNGETCYPQIPATLWPLLVSKTTVAVLEAIGDREGMAAAQAIAAEREKAARSIATPRSREVPRLISRNSYLRRGWR